MTKIPPWRLRILYLLLFILIGISVVPLGIYGYITISRNQEALKTNEMVLQVFTSESLAQEISLSMDNVRQHLMEFFDSIVPLASQIEASKYESDPRLLGALQGFASEQSAVIFVTALNNEAKGAQAGEFNAAADTFLRKALEAAFLAARQGFPYDGNPITITRSGKNEPVMLIARPLKQQGRFLGMVGAVVSLAPILTRLQDARKRTGLEAYIVDNSGKLIASNNAEKNVAGMDMAEIPIVQKFLIQGNAPVAVTAQFDLREGNNIVPMLGAFCAIPNVGWGVVVERKQSDAYYEVAEIRSQTLWLGLLVICISLLVGIISAKSITRPIDKLTQTARSIAKRDFTQRADVRSRTEIGELAGTFNVMAEDIQHYIGDLTEASEQNRQLFMGSIEMIAAAVDAKDPYTKGHSARVAQYSVILAKEMGLEEEEVNKIKISATLHDVGKIGIEDRVLKKPGVLTNEEFEIMKRHTIMGFEIVRQVKQLSEMLPGIRWHHEALNGKGYPDGLTGDELPLMVRIMSVADTFDAITTDRPYQAGKDFPQAMQILRKLAGSKYDPIVVDAMHAAYEKGELRSAEIRRSSFITVPAAAPTPAATT
jgi:HD-GYP domain-containing protein (c-di-GMP phosphodiesterase class II)